MYVHCFVRKLTIHPASCISAPVRKIMHTHASFQKQCAARSGWQLSCSTVTLQQELHVAVAAPKTMPALQYRSLSQVKCDDCIRLSSPSFLGRLQASVLRMHVHARWGSVGHVLRESPQGLRCDLTHAWNHAACTPGYTATCVSCMSEVLRE